jgi:hypothetical protein
MSATLRPPETRASRAGARGPENRVGGFCRRSAMRARGLAPQSQTSRRVAFATATKTASGPSHWPNRDPIEENGGVNLYAFLQNDPIAKYDMLGMWGTSGHTIIASRWLTKYSNYKWIEGSSVDVVGLVDLGSQKVDGDTGSSTDFLNAQSQANSYQHAMRSPLQSVASARAEMERFVREKVNAARNMAIVARRECDVEKLKKAVTLFGEGMHPVMDSTSPSHSGFQVWFGPSWALLSPAVYASFVANHHYKETDADLQGILASVIATMRSHDGEIDEILKKGN